MFLLYAVLMRIQVYILYNSRKSDQNFNDACMDLDFIHGSFSQSKVQAQMREAQAELKTSYTN